jgi:chromosome segregation ATPase
MIDRKKLQVELLKNEYEVKKSRLESDKGKCKEIVRRIGQRNEIMKKYYDKILYIKRYLSKLEKTGNIIEKEQKKVNLEIIELEKRRVKELNGFIFNVTEIKPTL